MKKIVINAGHHDLDPGYVITKNGKTYKEADFNKAVRDHLIRILKEKGDFEVFSVPDNLNLNSSIQWANFYKPDLALDIHFNAVSQKTPNGTEVLHGDHDLIEAGQLSRVLAGELGLRDRGPKHHLLAAVGSLGWVRYIPGMSLVIEVCFMSNEKDFSRIMEPNGFKDAAMGIAKGIYEIFEVDFEKKVEIPKKPVRRNLWEMIMELINTLINGKKQNRTG